MLPPAGDDQLGVVVPPGLHEGRGRHGPSRSSSGRYCATISATVAMLRSRGLPVESGPRRTLAGLDGRRAGPGYRRRPAERAHGGDPVHGGADLALPRGRYPGAVRQLSPARSSPRTRARLPSLLTASLPFTQGDGTNVPGWPVWAGGSLRRMPPVWIGLTLGFVSALVVLGLVALVGGHRVACRATARRRRRPLRRPAPRKPRQAASSAPTSCREYAPHSALRIGPEVPFSAS